MPDVRVTSVRRTVRVAVALVTGQALLCGIIGVVTFGGGNASAPGARAVEPQLAGPPVVVPTGSEPPVGAPARHPEPGTTSSGRIARPAAPRASVATRNSATRAPVPARTSPVPPAPPRPPAPVTSPPNLGLQPPSAPPPAPKEDAPVPVVLWERCDDEGATGETVDGLVARCERGRDGDLRWHRV